MYGIITYMKERVVFLDFDGVIRVVPEDVIVWSFAAGEFCDLRMYFLAKACKDLNLKIVVSSDWRRYDNREEIEKNIPQLVPYLHDDWMTPIKGHRHTEIRQWLVDHPEVVDCVILDDVEQHFDGCSPWMYDKLVLCETVKGLTKSVIRGLYDVLDEQQ